MATKTAKKPAAPARLTDEELTTLIKQFVAKLPDAGTSTVYKAIRSAGRSVSGGRVREAMAALHTKPAKKARAKTAA